MTVDTVTMISTFIGQMGFPIFVAVWMLFKSSTDSKNMTEALNSVQQAITIMSAKLENNNK
jgi:hypothetical protein